MKKGFTLMEMLIVIAVIAILVAIAIPGFRGMQDQANKARAQAELKTLKTAVESYALNNAGVYPGTGANWETALTGATPKIVENELYDPFGATSTSDYGYATAGKYYVIYSAYPTGTTKAVYATGSVEGTATVYATNTGN
ncbi:MAG: type II secretion system protein [Candidatus Saganbacteria bacterium]|nr:type II secretion system protein [Candidatus Saganbacteria bacterium]